ncbi:MAG: thiamine-monophosphate kinase, partial [Alphaproteobacteria bacterium]
MREFELIRSILAPLSEAGPPALGLADDAAILTPPPGCELVLSKDLMVAGVHFFPDDAPDLVARKLLRVNLSDLAAMGAAPLGYLLGLAFPAAIDEGYARRFAHGLARDQQEFGCRLLGGDTVAGAERLVLSLTILGQVPAGTALTRAGARPGDRIFVSGSVGDAALALRALRGGGEADPALVD